MKEKLRKIKKEDIQLYLDIWGYSGIVFAADSPEILELSRTWVGKGMRPDAGQCLRVTAQEEDQVTASEKNSYGIRQLLYELEVFSQIPPEIRTQVTQAGWIRFLVRFVQLYQETGWTVCLTKEMPLATRLEEATGKNRMLEKAAPKDHCYENYMIVQNGEGGKAEVFFQKYQKHKRIEVQRMIVLFRAYLIELLARYFREKLSEKGVGLEMVNWHWANLHPLYPKEHPVSAELEERKQYAVSQIAGHTDQYADFLSQIYPETDGRACIREVMEPLPCLDLGLGNLVHPDRYGACVQIVSGERRTDGQPQIYQHTVYLIGSCVFFGYAVKDSETVASYLQKKLHAALDKQWKVVNYGTWGGDFDQIYQRLYQIRFQPGDLVIVSYAGWMPVGRDWEKRDVSACLSQVPAREFYFDRVIHCSGAGYEKVAGRMLELFLEEFCHPAGFGGGFFLEPCHPAQKSWESQAMEYADHIRGQLPQLEGKNVGAVVVNCNPFTFGHQYLIGYAAARMDVLLVFVVEEDRSFFPFTDRIRLVREGTRHLKNVYVVPSGQLIISTVTFPGYFVKDTPGQAAADPALDVEIFGSYLAKEFHIRTRFAGEEPFDEVTRNYNESMRRILPRFGVAFVTVPRKEYASEPVSASRVRRLLKEKDFKQIRNLVPACTYTYLAKRYGGPQEEQG